MTKSQHDCFSQTCFLKTNRSIKVSCKHNESSCTVRLYNFIFLLSCHGSERATTKLTHYMCSCHVHTFAMTACFVMFVPTRESAIVFLNHPTQTFRRSVLYYINKSTNFNPFINIYKWDSSYIFSTLTRSTSYNNGF